jgi:hypothetical protein
MKPTNLVFAVPEEHNKLPLGCRGHDSMSNRPGEKPAYL